MQIHTHTTEHNCSIEKFAIPSPSMKREIKIVVILPPAYQSNPTQHFPILHTLHGYGAPYDTFSHMIPLQNALTKQPMIVTCLDGDQGSFYVDSPICPNSQFNTFFFNEFIPYLDNNYRTDPQNRAVTGFSMGGYGAFQYMTAQPNAFKSVSSLSGAFYHLDDPELIKRGRFTDILGPYNTHKKYYDFNDPYLRIDSLLKQKIKLPPIYLHCGTEDSLIDTNRDMNNFLTERNCNIKYLESPGQHDWTF